MTPDTGIYGWAVSRKGVDHFRVAEPLRGASLYGIRTGMGNRLDDEICGAYNTILVNMLHHAHAAPAWESLAKAGAHRLIIDIDDAMWAPDWEVFKMYYQPDVLKRLFRAVEIAHVVTTPSPIIAEYLAQYNQNVWIVPNYVPAYVLFQTQRRRPRKIVGYQGSSSHDPDISPEFLADMYDFVRESGWVWKLWGKRPSEVQGWPKGWVETIPWVSSLREYYRSLSMDIGIGPLKPSTFTASKSSLRAVEYAALGIPAVLSKSPCYAGDWVIDGVTGLLLDENDSWRDALMYLATDEAARVKMGMNARRHAMENRWSVEDQIPRWLEAWNSVD